MTRGAGVVHGNMVYCRPANSCRVYTYRFIHGDEQWSQLPDNPNEHFGLGVVYGHITCVGGRNNGAPTNQLLREGWLETFSSMPTPRHDTACVTMEQTLVVAGGWDTNAALNSTVGIMQFSKRQWTTAIPLTQECWCSSASIYGDSLYLADVVSSKSVFSCSLSDLFTSTTLVQNGYQAANTEMEESSSASGRSNTTRVA